MTEPIFLDEDTATTADIVRVLNRVVRVQRTDHKMTEALETALLGEREDDYDVTGHRGLGMADKVDAMYSATQNGGLRSKPSRQVAVWGAVIVAAITTFGGIVVAIITNGN